MHIHVYHTICRDVSYTLTPNRRAGARQARAPGWTWLPFGPRRRPAWTTQNHVCEQTSLQYTLLCESRGRLTPLPPAHVACWRTLDTLMMPLASNFTVSRLRKSTGLRRSPAVPPTQADCRARTPNLHAQTYISASHLPIAVAHARVVHRAGSMPRARVGTTAGLGRGQEGAPQYD